PQPPPPRAAPRAGRGGRGAAGRLERAAHGPGGPYLVASPDTSVRRACGRGAARLPAPPAAGHGPAGAAIGVQRHARGRTLGLRLRHAAAPRLAPVRAGGLALEYSEVAAEAQHMPVGLADRELAQPPGLRHRRLDHADPALHIGGMQAVDILANVDDDLAAPGLGLAP